MFKVPQGKNRFSNEPRLKSQVHRSKGFFYALRASGVFFFGFFFISFPAWAEPLSAHFDRKEISCRCCHKVIVNQELLNKLELLRTVLGNKPIIINSAYRCPKHNKEVGGVKNSQHLQGKACDVRVRGLTPSYVAQQAKKVGFSFTKVYGNFAHIDVR